MKLANNPTADVLLIELTARKVDAANPRNVGN